MIIQIHSCSGKFNFKLTDKIIDYDNNPNDIPVVNNTDEYGRSKYLVDNLKHMHLYLSIKSSQLPQDCESGKKKDGNGIECSKELSYLIKELCIMHYVFLQVPQSLQSLDYAHPERQLCIIYYALCIDSGYRRYHIMLHQDAVARQLQHRRDLRRHVNQRPAHQILFAAPLADHDRRADTGSVFERQTAILGVSQRCQGCILRRTIEGAEFAHGGIRGILHQEKTMGGAHQRRNHQRRRHKTQFRTDFLRRKRQKSVFRQESNSYRPRRHGNSRQTRL